MEIKEEALRLMRANSALLEDVTNQTVNATRLLNDGNEQQNVSFFKIRKRYKLTYYLFLKNINYKIILKHVIQYNLSKSLWTNLCVQNRQVFGLYRLN